MHGSAKKSSNSTNDLPQGQTRGEKSFDRALALGPHRGPKHTSWQKWHEGASPLILGADGDGADGAVGGGGGYTLFSLDAVLEQKGR